MKTRHSSSAILVLLTISSLLLLPSVSRAQAGLTGNALEDYWENERTKAGNFGSNNQSALGQLEEISGGKVDRSSSSSRTTPTRTVQQPQPAKPRYNSEQVLRQQFTGALAGALVGALFSNLLNDNSAQQRAEAEARARAEAAAQAEALRVQQELARQARIHKALRYRAEWDAREGEITNRLGGAFDLRTGSSFFGQSASLDPAVLAILNQPGEPSHNQSPSTNVPAATDSDPSVVDLTESSLVVNPLRDGVVTTSMPSRSSGSLMPRWAWDWAPPPPPRRSPGELEQLIAYFSPWMAKWYKETVVQGAIKSTLWGVAKRTSQHFGENMVLDYGQGLSGFHEQRTGLIETLGGRAENLIKGTILGQATDVAYTVSDPNSRSSAYLDSHDRFLDYTARKLKTDTYETTAEQMFSKYEMPDAADLKSPSVNYNLTRTKPSTHADQSRTTNILLGTSKNTARTLTHPSTNGLPISFGPPASL